MVENQVHVVIDNGSGFIKAGFSAEESPRTIFPNAIGIPRQESMVEGEVECNKELYFGKETTEKRGILNLRYPVENGIIKEWSDMEKLWQYTMTNELKVNPEDHNIMLTEPPLNPKTNREKLTQIFFEIFNVPGIYLSVQATLTLYSTGKTSGMILDSGHGVTDFVPIFEGYAFPHSILKSNIGGKDLTNYLVQILGENGVQLGTSSEREFARDIKEKLCYLSLDYNRDIRESNTTGSVEVKYELPDSEQITIGSERFRCPEALFKPYLIGKEFNGIHDTCYQAIMKSDLDIRKELYSNIILAGGSTMFDYFAERLTQEIQKLAPSSLSNKIKAFAMPERKYCAWIGGSILSSLSHFQIMWVTKSEYDDAGPQIVHRKCF